MPITPKEVSFGGIYWYDFPGNYSYSGEIWKSRPIIILKESSSVSSDETRNKFVYAVPVTSKAHKGESISISYPADRTADRSIQNPRRHKNLVNSGMRNAIVAGVMTIDPTRLRDYQGRLSIYDQLRVGAGIAQNVAGTSESKPFGISSGDVLSLPWQDKANPADSDYRRIFVVLGSWPANAGPSKLVYVMPVTLSEGAIRPDMKFRALSMQRLRQGITLGQVSEDHLYDLRLLALAKLGILEQIMPLLQQMGEAAPIRVAGRIPTAGTALSPTLTMIPRPARPGLSAPTALAT